LLTSTVIAVDFFFAIVILSLKKRDRVRASYGIISVALGLFGIAIPAALLIWRI
jgi:hypothetical protein